MEKVCSFHFHEERILALEIPTKVLGVRDPVRIELFIKAKLMSVGSRVVAPELWGWGVEGLSKGTNMQGWSSRVQRGDCTEPHYIIDFKAGKRLELNCSRQEKEMIIM